MTEPQPERAHLGKYEIIELIGEGATASVYHARDTYLKRDVALKILKPALIADATSFTRFAQEAQSSSTIFHSHIAAVLDMGEAQGRYFIVMQYVPGQSLDKYLKANGPLPLEEILRMASQIGEALDHIHRKGFLHRDVKPSNIMRTPDGEYVLTDFGLLRAMMTTGLTSHTGAILGTPSYIAPEIWLDQPSSPATDQYAFACVVAEALTGKVAFTGDTPPAIMTAHVLKGTQVLEVSAIPRLLLPVLRRGLAKEPAKRFANLAAFAEALRKAAQPRPTAQPRPVAPPARAAPAREPPAAQAERPTEEPVVTPAPPPAKITPSKENPPAPADAPPRESTATPAAEPSPAYRSPAEQPQAAAPPPSEPLRLAPFPDVETLKVPQKSPAKWYWIGGGLAAVIVIAFIASNWSPAAIPTQAPAPTYAPTLTSPPFEGEVPPAQPEPTTAPQPVFSGPLLSRSAENCGYGGEFLSIEAVDQYTVRFTLCYPDPGFPSKVSLPVFAIADSDDLNATGGDSLAMSAEPNGTGPFMLDRWESGFRVVYTANPNYWGGAPQYANLILRWIGDPRERLLDLQAGNSDGFDNVSTDDYGSVYGDSSLVMLPREPWNIFYLGFQVDQPPFNDERVRLAIAHAVERQSIVEAYFPAGSLVANVFAPPPMNPGFYDVEDWHNYDPELARQLLAEAGYPGGLDIPLYYRNVVRTYLPSPAPVALEIQRQLGQVGIKVNLVEMDSSDFLTEATAGNLGFYMLGWNADYPDAANFYDYHFANGSNYQFGTPFSDIMELLLEASQISDSEKRIALYGTANARIKEHIPMIPVAHGTSAVVFRASVGGAASGPLGNEPFHLMQPEGDALVFLQSIEPQSLWCADETDADTMRACQQIYEPLLTPGPSGSGFIPLLAQAWDSDPDATAWTFYLRQGVKFHNGADLDANDVVATFAALWDAAVPNHRGRTGDFAYYGAFFGQHLNAP